MVGVSRKKYYKNAPWHMAHWSSDENQAFSPHISLKLLRVS